MWARYTRTARNKLIQCTETNLGPALKSTLEYVRKLVSFTHLIEPCLKSPTTCKRSMSSSSDMVLLPTANGLRWLMMRWIICWSVLLNVVLVFRHGFLLELSTALPAGTCKRYLCMGSKLARQKSSPMYRYIRGRSESIAPFPGSESYITVCTYTATV